MTDETTPRSDMTMTDQATAADKPPENADITGAPALPADELHRLTDDIVAAIKTVYDPEIPVNIYDLGLIYQIDVSERGNVALAMTLTAPACPVAGTLPKPGGEAVKAVAGVKEVAVKLVWDPPWSQECMSDEARLSLGLLIQLVSGKTAKEIEALDLDEVFRRLRLDEHLSPNRHVGVCAIVELIR